MCGCFGRIDRRVFFSFFSCFLKNLFHAKVVHSSIRSLCGVPSYVLLTRGITNASQVKCFHCLTSCTCRRLHCTTGDGKAGGNVRRVPMRAAPATLRSHGKLLLLTHHTRYALSLSLSLLSLVCCVVCLHHQTCDTQHRTPQFRFDFAVLREARG